jgi:HSP20 family protein
MALNKTCTSLQFIRREAGGADSDSEPFWAPNTDVFLVGESLVVQVELAGLRKEDLELTVEGNRLRISGHRPDSCREVRCRFLVMEINYGAFESVIEVPSGYDLGHARAAYQNGFLKVDIPPKASAEVRAGSAAVDVPIRASET